MTAVLPDRATAVADPDTIHTWLQTLHGASRGWLWVGSDLDRFRGRTYPLSNPRWADLAARYVQQLDRDGAAGIYTRTTTLRAAPRTGRGGDDDSLSLPGLAADLDIAGPGHKGSKPLPADVDAAMGIVHESGLPDPSVWVHSGGGLYAWWLLSEPHHIGPDLGRIKRLGMRWQDPIAAAAGRLGYNFGRLGDLARILRIPGTVNRKPAMPAPAPCRILDDTGRRYSLENLRGCLTDALDAMPAPEPVRAPARPVARRDGELAPWDDYNERADWADILEPHGWTLAFTRGNTRYWTRPGKDRRDGTSATTGRDLKHDRMWVFTDAAPGFDANQLYRKFDVYLELEHGGDVKAAVRALRTAGYGDERAVAA